MINRIKDKIILFVKKNGYIYNAQKFVRGCIYSTKWMPYVRTKIKVKWVYIVLCVLSFPIGIVNWLFTPQYDDLPSDGLAIVAIVKNEARYIQEWIDFYRILGVDKIIIFDNGSTDQTATIIKQYGGVIDYYFFPGVVRQLDAYNVALKKYKNRYRYMAFVDCDEFLYSEDGLYKTIDYLFSKRQNMGGLGVNWLTFGSSGYQKRPAGGVVENYLWRAEEKFASNHVIKSIVIPKRTFAYVSPHYPIYRRGYCGFDELGRELMDDRTRTVSTKYVRINHYFTKSMEDWIEKVNKGRADLFLHRNLKEFEERDKNEVFDDRLLRSIKVWQSQVAKENKKFEV